MSPTRMDESSKQKEPSGKRRFHLHRAFMLEASDEDPFVWSIADIITQLLIFFILLYANASKLIPQVHTPPRLEVKTVEQKDNSVDQLRQDVARFMEENQDQSFSLRWDKERPVFILGERITFEEGKAELLEGFLPTLKRIVDFIAAQQGYQVLVSGHTDNMPINTVQFPTNWELSSARAASVARFLCNNGMDPQRVSIHGYAEYHPLVENSSPENRQANRRVEITLTKEY